ncbi:MAG: 1-acyl-sn-glycerol-3-phosphate acyltransferase [Tannerellaceae bacterium]|jgi:1-acyl-sn-glycerol-3-phosphate acyltransferase|nr:1-acyl-sn-glycerol-3-phosphate acyltransferase [Tannerellaceae bacterium]
MIRTLYFLYTWLIFAPIFLLATIITALVTITGCVFGGERIFSYYPGMIWSKLACGLALCPVKVKGRENIKKGMPAIYVANHQGAFDIFLIYGFLGTPIKWMLKMGLSKIPFVGAACRAAGFIFVDHKTSKAAAHSVTEAGKALRKGSSICIFPEGSRSLTGKMRRFKRGAFQMAVDLHVQIVPITLNGPYCVLPIGSARLRRHRMELIIHQPILPTAASTEHADSSRKDVEELAARTYSVIESGLWPRFRASI